MGWSGDQKETTKKGMETSSKILLAIIVCVIFIIILLVLLLMNMKKEMFTISVDNAPVTIDKDNLIAQIDNITYLNIEEFANLVGYEYHEGEYKFFTLEKDKCYVQGVNETATFYLNDNKVCKLPLGELTEDYREYTVENTIKDIDGKMYASIEAINKAFNVVVDESETSLDIYTLDYLVSIYDERVKEWKYTGISDQEFENKKSLLYGYLIVKKENGLYKIIDNENKKEIVPDKYNSIQFIEDTQEFFVTNSLGQVGIINLDGTPKIEPIYESISVLDKKSDLYLIKKDSKYGIVKSGNTTIVYPEYERIGLDMQGSTANVENQYLISDTLIPVYKDNKWGAFDKDGNMILKLEYDGFGCNVNTVEVNRMKKAVLPVFYINECKGLVVKKAEKYGVLDLKGKELVPVAVDSIYEVEVEKKEDEDERFYMLYNNKELNVINQLRKAGLIEENNKEQDESNKTNQKNNNTVETSAPVANNYITNVTADNTTNKSISNTVNGIQQ